MFFRAKEWDDAIKVLKGMIGLDGIVLPSALNLKFAFLSDFGVEFGGFIGHIGGNYSTPIFLLAGIIIPLAFKNSTQKLNDLKMNFLQLLFNIFLLSMSFIYLGQYTEFLYFNF